MPRAALGLLPMQRVPFVTAISASPVRYTSFISVQLESKPPVPPALSTLRLVCNPARDELPSSLNRTPAAAPHGSGPVSPAAGSSPNAAASASDWKDYVGRLQQQDAVPGARHADPDQGVVTPSNISVKQMVAYFLDKPPATPAGVAQVVRPPMPAPAAAVAVQIAAVTAPATVPSASVLQADDPVPADEARSRTVPANQMEHPHRAAEAEAALIGAQLPEEERALDEELGALAEAQRPRGAELPMEDEEDPFHASELFGTTPPKELVTVRKVRFNEFGTSRVNEVDAESGETISISDQRFQTKEHDGKWSAPSAHLQSPLNPFGRQPEERWSPGFMAVPHAPVASDDSDFVVQSVLHEDRYDQPNHAEIGEGFWADLGRDDERAEPGVGEALLQLQQLQALHRKLEAALRYNQQLKEEVSVHF